MLRIGGRVKRFKKTNLHQAFYFKTGGPEAQAGALIFSQSMWSNIDLIRALENAGEQFFIQNVNSSLVWFGVLYCVHAECMFIAVRCWSLATREDSWSWTTIGKTCTSEQQQNTRWSCCLFVIFSCKGKTWTVKISFILYLVCRQYFWKIKTYCAIKSKAKESRRVDFGWVADCFDTAGSWRFLAQLEHFLLVQSRQRLSFCLFCWAKNVNTCPKETGR